MGARIEDGDVQLTRPSDRKIRLTQFVAALRAVVWTAMTNARQVLLPMLRTTLI